jgi:hypothetical protein
VLPVLAIDVTDTNKKAYRRRIECEYPAGRKQRTIRDLGDSPTTPVSPGRTNNERPDVGQFGLSHPIELDILAARFLDPHVFTRMQWEIPKCDVAVTKEASALVGNVQDIRAIASVFFNSVHIWMPILSKKQFFSRLPGFLTYKQAEFFLLILSMKLCSTTDGVTAKGRLYRTVKELQLKVESSGMLSLQVLQAGLLITLHELGHAIYPAVLLSTAYCARYATVLGVDRSILVDAGEMPPKVDEEECRRAWWSVIILDRYVP